MPSKKQFDLVKRVRASLSAHREREAGRLSLQKAQVPIPDVDVKSIRDRLHLSQREFATLFGLSLGSLRNWEQGIRRPEQPVALLLHLIASDPEHVAAEVQRLKREGGGPATTEHGCAIPRIKIVSKTQQTLGI